jgi:hypothetical protein
MWIVTNESFLSIVQNRDNPDEFVVRARIDGDIEEFLGRDFTVLETSDSDYRFRAFVPKSVVKVKMMDQINSINYDNFKDSVKDFERKDWYTQIWTVMYRVQEAIYGTQNWWTNYKK